MDFSDVNEALPRRGQKDPSPNPSAISMASSPAFHPSEDDSSRRLAPQFRGNGNILRKFALSDLPKIAHDLRPEEGQLGVGRGKANLHLESEFHLCFSVSPESRL